MAAQPLFTEFKNNLLEVMKNASYTKEIDNVIDSFLYRFNDFYRFDCCEVYLISGEKIILRGVAGLDRYYVCKVEHPASDELFKRVLEQSEIVIGENSNSTEFSDYDVFTGMVCIPIGIFSENFGVFIIRFRNESFSLFEENRDDIISLLGHFAVHVNDMYQTFHSKYRNIQITLLKELGLHLLTNEKMNDIIRDFTSEIARIFQAKASALYMLDGTETFRLRSSWGLSADMLPHEMPTTGTVIREVIKSGGFFSTNAIHREPAFREFTRAEHSAVVMLLRVSGMMLGVLTVIDRVASAINPIGDFTEDDSNLVRNIGSQLAGRMYRENMQSILASFVERNERNNRKLYILYEITSSLLGHSKLEDILFILLVSSTIGNTSGFNRALLFLYDREKNLFQGKMGVAPLGETEGLKMWSAITENKGDSTLIEKIFMSLSEKEMHDNIDLTMKIARVAIPADERCPLLADIVNNHKGVSITNPAVSSNTIGAFTKLIGMVPFAVIPVATHHELYGILIVDNPISQKPIVDEDLGYLQMFANQTGIAIEYAMLRNTLEEREAELKSTQMKLDEAQRLAIIGEMSASIAHDLRNSIVSIGGFASRLNRMRLTEPKANQYVTIIHDEVTKLEGYLRKNLTFAKKVMLSVESVSISHITGTLTTLVNEHIKRSGKQLSFTVHDDGTLASIDCDYAQLHDVFMNIIINAIDAVPAQGAAITFSIAQGEKQDAVFEIMNTNSHIADSAIERIFDPFYTTKNTGVGLGLAIAKRIIDAHRGTIRVASGNADGAPYVIFTITIPLHMRA
ncbi:MAG: GAF domain-containing protein [Spirochaetes bacterium]|nr:GAF domain-containing protein [Spirochaetota bacterium]